VVALARNKQKIQAIKLYRELTRCDLATAKKVVDGL
jgi:ribosomal protein L7/L12